MSIRKVLLVCKQSAYTFYFLRNDVTGGRQNTQIIQTDRKRFESAHQEHYRTLDTVKSVLKKYKIPFKVTYRGRKIDYNAFDLIITVGGDGTFLEAARHAGSQLILGVNSAPSFSVGRFCVADYTNFENRLDSMLRGESRCVLLQRLSVEVDNKLLPFLALNDFLICHRNPAFLCRYHLKIGRVSEEQRSSGLWVSTPAGSTGAMQSSGGQFMSVQEKKFQYRPRELYWHKTGSPRLTGGTLGFKQSIHCVSLMRNGLIYVDGAHNYISFGYGVSVRMKISSRPLRTLEVNP